MQKYEVKLKYSNCFFMFGGDASALYLAWLAKAPHRHPQTYRTILIISGRFLAWLAKAPMEKCQILTRLSFPSHCWTSMLSGMTKLKFCAPLSVKVLYSDPLLTVMLFSVGFGVALSLIERSEVQCRRVTPKPQSKKHFDRKNKCTTFAPRLGMLCSVENENYSFIYLITMYAIVNIAGQQFKVAKDQTLFVHRLQGEEGASIEFDNVLLAENDGKFSVGTPTVEGAKVSAKILSHLKGDKVIVFKKKRRKGYKKKNGHRQQFSKIEITGITL